MKPRDVFEIAASVAAVGISMSIGFRLGEELAETQCDEVVVVSPSSPAALDSSLSPDHDRRECHECQRQRHAVIGNVIEGATVAVVFIASLIFLAVMIYTVKTVAP